MDRLKLALLLACASYGCGAEAADEAEVVQGRPAAAAGTSALELADLLVADLGEGEIAGRIEGSLLRGHAAWRGPRCDERLPACVEAARAVARDYARREASAIKAALVRLYAGRLGQAMSEAEMRAAISHLRSEPGAPLARGLRSLLTVDGRSFTELLGAIGGGAEAGSRGAIDAFYDRTEGLARRVERVAPPPPPPAPRR